MTVNTVLNGIRIVRYFRYPYNTLLYVQMKIVFAILSLLILFAYFVYDPLIEAPRLIEQMQKDLGITFKESPELLGIETFGWAEEGGDRSLFKIGESDCATIVNRLGYMAKPDAGSDYIRMFNEEGIEPSAIKTKFWSNTHGDTKLYVLAPSTCVLFREAFFE